MKIGQLYFAIQLLVNGLRFTKQREKDCWLNHRASDPSFEAGHAGD